MKLSLIFAAIIGIFTFLIFSGETSDTSIFERLLYSLVLFGVSFGLFELFRFTWDWLRDCFKKDK